MDRHRWAVDLLQLTGAEQILEIGCGPGLATVAACTQLTTGSVTAIDRSDTALARTKKRAAELAVLRRVLRPRSELHIVYETPWPEKAHQVASQVTNRLSSNGFSDVKVICAGSEFMSISGRRGETR